MKINIYLPFLALFLLSVATVASSESGHGHEEHEQAMKIDAHAEDKTSDMHEENEEGVIALSSAQQQTAGIVVELLRKRELATEIRAPGEVKLNAYSTKMVTTRVSAQVVKRHVTLGDRVTTGIPLVTLSSVDMAEAQGALMVADREWQRVKKLGTKVTSDRRHTEVRVARQLAYAKASAFGMTSQGIEEFLKSGDASKANGEFQVFALRDGTIVQEDFIEGAVIEPGHVLLTITDETSIWIEARLTPQQMADVNKDASVRVKTNSGWKSGRIVQAYHTLDENTRTIAVRIALPNDDDQLHPGEFVDVFLQSGQHDVVLAVPETAVVRSPDGDWQVFVAEHDNEFRAVEVNVLRSSGGHTIIEGVQPGAQVVTQGTFFLQSELAKSGFDIHNH